MNTPSTALSEPKSGHPELKMITLGKCPACTSTSNHLEIAHWNNFSIYKCDCSHRFIDPSLTPESMAALYQSSELLSQVNAACSEYFEYDVLNPSTKTFQDFSQSLRELEQLTVGRKLLDVGCGSGDFAKSAQSRGWKVTGVDSSPENVDAGKNKGLNVVRKNFSDFESPQSFDVITMWDLLEHVPDPIGMIKKCGSLLSPKGLLFIASPLYPNLLSSLAETFYRVSAHQISSPLKKMYMLEHTSYFSLKSLKATFKRAQFSCVKAWKNETDLNRYEFSLLTKQALRASFALARLLNLQNRVNAIARKQV